MAVILAIGTAVGISPEIAAARKVTTDLALDGAAKAVAVGANKTREIAADRLRIYGENQNSKQV
jgi:hypothetical protein